MDEACGGFVRVLVINPDLAASLRLYHDDRRGLPFECLQRLLEEAKRFGVALQDPTRRNSLPTPA